jgi:Putative peptidoglycan binding domain
MPDFQTPPTLSPGDSNDDVILLQQFLIVLGLDPNAEPSGLFDEDTALEVTSFKANQGLPDDPVVDPDTWAALFGAVGPLPTDDMPKFLLEEFPALSQLMSFGKSNNGGVDIDGYIASPLEEA